MFTPQYARELMEAGVSAPVAYAAAADEPGALEQAQREIDQIEQMQEWLQELRLQMYFGLN